MGFQNPLQARLRRDLKAQHQPGLPRHSHTLFCPSVVPNTMILLSMILPKWSVERRESSVESFCHFSPSPSLFHVPPQPRSAQADLSRRSRKARRRIPRFQHFRFTAFFSPPSRFLEKHNLSPVHRLQPSKEFLSRPNHSNPSAPYPESIS